jgi:hypothetical protein
MKRISLFLLFCSGLVFSSERKHSRPVVHRPPPLVPLSIQPQPLIQERSYIDLGVSPITPLPGVSEDFAESPGSSPSPQEYGPGPAASLSKLMAQESKYQVKTYKKLSPAIAPLPPFLQGKQQNKKIEKEIIPQPKSFWWGFFSMCSSRQKEGNR